MKSLRGMSSHDICQVHSRKQSGDKKHLSLFLWVHPLSLHSADGTLASKYWSRRTINTVRWALQEGDGVFTLTAPRSSDCMEHNMPWPPFSTWELALGLFLKPMPGDLQHPLKSSSIATRKLLQCMGIGNISKCPSASNTDIETPKFRKPFFLMVEGSEPKASYMLVFILRALHGLQQAQVTPLFPSPWLHTSK